MPSTPTPTSALGAEERERMARAIDALAFNEGASPLAREEALLTARAALRTLSENGVSDAVVERVARKLARAEWPVRDDDEDDRTMEEWIERRWPRFVGAARDSFMAGIAALSGES